jgi:hypothetical protein
MVEEYKKQLKVAKELKTIHDRLVEVLEKNIEEFEKPKILSDRDLGEKFLVTDSFGNTMEVVVIGIYSNSKYNDNI